MPKSLFTFLLIVCWIFNSQAQSIGITPDNNSVNLLKRLDNSIKQTYPILFTHSIVSTRQDSVVLFKTMPNRYKPKQNLPLFCAIEHQLSKLIKRRVKLGVP